MGRFYQLSIVLYLCSLKNYLYYFLLCHWILLFLRKDYYLTDVIFMGKTLTDFVEDLKTLSLPELSPIIELLEQAEIEKIRISGD